jgi:hypothetical protein
MVIISLLHLRVLQGLINNLISVLEDRYMWAEIQPDKQSLHFCFKILRGLKYSLISNLTSVYEDTWLKYTLISDPYA